MTTKIRDVTVHVEGTPHIKVHLPRAHVTSWGEPVIIPWYTHVDDVFRFSADRSALVALRDALTEALDRHPDDSPAESVAGS